jgi:hypothetical protein
MREGRMRVRQASRAGPKAVRAKPAWAFLAGPGRPHLQRSQYRVQLLLDGLRASRNGRHAAVHGLRWQRRQVGHRTGQRRMRVSCPAGRCHCHGPEQQALTAAHDCGVWKLRYFALQGRTSMP